MKTARRKFRLRGWAVLSDRPGRIGKPPLVYWLASWRVPVKAVELLPGERAVRVEVREL